MLLLALIVANTPESVSEQSSEMCHSHEAQSVRPWRTVSSAKLAFHTTAQQTTVPGLGCKLAARLRSFDEEQILSILIQGVKTDQVRKHGLQIRAKSGPIIAATGQRLQIHSLLDALVFENESRPSPFRMDSPQTLRPALDQARNQARIEAVHSGDFLATPYRGFGVLIAAYDTGIDQNHSAFLNEKGETRIHSIWSQDANHFCSRQDIDQKQCPLKDVDGHGTLTLSVAAGSDDLYSGAAPQAKVIMATSSSFEGLIPALAWFSEIAQRTKSPLVTNLSLAGHEGPHDGTSMESLAINAHAHLVVAAAGNDAKEAIHISGVLSAQDLGVKIPIDFSTPNGPSQSFVEIWGEADSIINAQVNIQNKDAILLAESASVFMGAEGISQTLKFGDIEILSLKLDAESTPNPANQKVHIRLEITIPELDLLANIEGQVIILLSGEGRFSAWMDAPPTTKVRPRFLAPSNQKGSSTASIEHSITISDIATSSMAIAVSSLISRTKIESSPDHEGYQRPGALGQVSGFSSHGPSADSARTGQKPDLIAPGQFLLAASSTSQANASLLAKPWAAASGTSVSSALTSGIAALLLSADRDLSRFELRENLFATARKLNQKQSNGDEDARQGHGQVDALAAISRLAPPDAGCACQHTKHQKTAPWLCVLFLALLWRRSRGFISSVSPQFVIRPQRLST